MLTAQQNELVTRTGANRPAGRLLRRYWQPVALAEELLGARPLKALQIFGSEYVLFRDERGRLGLLDRDCPHRNADLAYGRLEDGGLRCAFHGWLFDVGGRCLETPAEPEDSTFCTKIRQGAYPVQERNGIVFAYLGEGEPPVLPALDCFRADDVHTFAFKGYWACNWLQAVEVGIDPAHASYLHRFFEDEHPQAGYGKQFRSASAETDLPVTRVLREFSRPEILVRPAPYGLSLVAVRRLSAQNAHVRMTNMIFPNAIVVPMSSEMTLTQWHVPIDDVSSFWYAIFTSFTSPVDKDAMRQQRLELYTLPDYKPRVNRENQYGFRPEEQTRTYTGMGDDINVHDQWAVESQGAVQNRTREHLGQSDRGITAYRRLLFDALKCSEDGATPLMVLDAAAAAAVTGPPTVDGVGPADAWEPYWMRAIDRRAAAASWAAPAAATTAS
jgi:phthalate 4,5-dioxygenase